MVNDFDRPFPALTPAQRLHFEIYGYVIVENTLSAAEVARCKDALYALREEIEALDDPSSHGPRVRGAYFTGNSPTDCLLSNVIEAAPALTAYSTHPRLVGMAEEVMGCAPKIVEVAAIMNHRREGEHCHVFHRGMDVPYGSHEKGGLYHCTFVKTLTNLTDLGPDNGGTVVIAGSHKLDLPQEELIAIAEADRSLIHQVVAPAGSTLLLAETLIHGTGENRSDKERVIIVCGYGTRMYPYWDNGELSDAFRESIPPALVRLFLGRKHWNRQLRYRKLSDPVDQREFELGTWDDRVPLE